MEKEILLKVEVDRAQAQKELEATTRQLLDNKKAISELNTAFKTGKVSTDQYVRESISLKKSQKELTDQQKVLTKELAAEVGSVDQLRLRLAALTRERNSTNQSTAEGAASAKDLTEQIKATSDAIKEQEEAGGDFRRNVGNYSEAFTEAAGGVKVFGTSLGDMFKVITTNPIGIIVAALAGLFQALKQNDTIATFFKGTMTGVSIVLDNVAAFIADAAISFNNFLQSGSKSAEFVKEFGTRLFNFAIAPLKLLLDLAPAAGALLEGKFGKAATLAGEAVTSFGKSFVLANGELPKFLNSIKDSIGVGVEFEKVLDDIEAKQSKLNVSIAEMEKQRDRLALQSKDLSKSEQERIELENKADAINKNILKDRLSLLDEEIAAREKYKNALGKDSTDREQAEFKLNDLAVQRIGFEKEAIAFEEKNLNRKNALLEKVSAQTEKIRSEAEKARDDQEKGEAKKNEAIKQGDYNLSVFKAEQAIKNSKTFEEEIDAQLALEKIKVDQLLSNDNLLASEREIILINYEKKKQEIIDDGNRREIKANQLKEQSKLATTKQFLSYAKSAFTENTIAYKAIASTQAIIDTYQSATAAYRSVVGVPYIGPELAVAAAAAAVAAGFENIAEINAAAGGGDFVTTKPTLLLVGDNPGGRERVTVEPLSGKGKTKIHKDSGMIAMAGGGTLTTTGATLTRPISNQINDSIIISQLLSAFKSMPTPVVSFQEFTTFANRVKIKESIRKG